MSCKSLKMSSQNNNSNSYRIAPIRAQKIFYSNGFRFSDTFALSILCVIRILKIKFNDVRLEQNKCFNLFKEKQL